MDLDSGAEKAKQELSEQRRALFFSAFSVVENAQPEQISPFQDLDRFELDQSDLSAPEKPVPRNSEKWRKQHEELAAKAKAGSPELVFYGDSITAGMSFSNALKNYFGDKAENFGIVGDSTQHLLYRLQNGEADFARAPKKGVILIGANNIGHARVDDVVKGIVANLHEAQKQQSQTSWIVLGVLPQGRSPNDPRRAQIRELNEKLEDALSGIAGVKFLDLGGQLLEKDGSMSDRIWWKDGLHPRNYEPIFDALRPEL